MATGSIMREISCANRPLMSATESAAPNRPSAILAVTRSAVSTPISAEINNSSNCSSISSSKRRLGDAAGPPRPKIRPRRPFARLSVAETSAGADVGLDAETEADSRAGSSLPTDVKLPNAKPPGGCGAGITATGAARLIVLGSAAGSGGIAGLAEYNSGSSMGSI